MATEALHDAGRLPALRARAVRARPGRAGRAADLRQARRRGARAARRGHRGLRRGAVRRVDGAQPGTLAAGLGRVDAAAHRARAGGRPAGQDRGGQPLSVWRHARDLPRARAAGAARRGARRESDRAGHGRRGRRPRVPGGGGDRTRPGRRRRRGGRLARHGRGRPADGGRAGGRAVRGARRQPEARYGRRRRRSSSTADQRATIHTPAGLDIGARTPEEIALSVFAQIIAERPRAPRQSRSSIPESPACCCPWSSPTPWPSTPSAA